MTVSTDLAMPAKRAVQLAQRTATLQHVLWPLLTATPSMRVPDTIAEGDRISIHLRFFGILPCWTHEVQVQRLAEHEIVSREHGGPIAAWNHRLTFEPTSPTTCRYTDAVEVHAGVLTPFAFLFAAGMYRYRQARWRGLARVLPD